MKTLKIYSAMKAIAIISTLLFTSFQLTAQNAQVIIEDTRKTFEERSYWVVKSLVLEPGFTVQASTDGDFFAKAYQTAQNVPPSLDQNFVRTETARKPGMLSENDLALSGYQDRSVIFDYFDGLGRSVQTINVKASTTHKDVFELFQYDNNGRQVKEFLPFTYSSSNGKYRTTAQTDQTGFYNGSTHGVPSDTRPYAENKFESTTLDRVTERYDPGAAWFNNDKKQQTYTKVNGANEVKYWTISGSSPVSSSFHPTNTLTYVENIDEDGRVVREYSDMLGQVLLKRVKLTATTWADTYYVYDEQGNTRFVIPPKAVSSGTLTDLVFCYEYDEKQRMIKKKIPGKDWEYFVYDAWDRLILSQDGNLSTQPGGPYWKFIKYDQFNRVIMEGIYPSSSVTIGIEYSVEHHETQANNVLGYTLDATYPALSNTSLVKSVTYYDNYNFLDYTNWDANASRFNYVNEPDLNASKIPGSTVKGQVTGTKVQNLRDGGWLSTVNYYDKKYRNIQTISDHHLNGTDRISNEYDFVDNVLKTKRTHTSSTESFVTLEISEYDHADRLIKLHHSIDGGPQVLLTSNRYNEIGEVIEQNHYSPSGELLQSEDFRYNIRGWISSINNSALNNDGGATNDDSNDLFGMNLLYHDNVAVNGNGITPRYNGNIAAWKWNVDNLEDSRQEKIYGYEYDSLERITSASYAVKNGASWNGQAGMFDMSVSEYDENGNIRFLDRFTSNNGVKTQIDQLKYTYRGNQLYHVEDVTGNEYGFNDKFVVPSTTDEYDYDRNGNMVEDANKGIDITYNYLNLPEDVLFTGNREIRYTYDALGNKLVSEADDGTIDRTDYISGVHYVNGQLAFMATPEGRAVKTDTGWDYEYFMEDHLGNVRATYSYSNEIEDYKATMETERASTENSTFSQLTNRSTDHNHTQGTQELQSPNESLLLNALLTGGTIGAAKELEVKANDKVSMQVFARYTTSSGSINDVVGPIVNAITSAFGITPTTDGGLAHDAFNTHAQGLMDGVSSSSQPKAFLTYILFDRNYANVPQFGYQPITTSAGVGFEELSMDIPIPYDGYLYIYLTNESDYNVFFDDMQVVHEKSNRVLQVMQANDYYPFGLTFNSFQRSTTKENKFKYNGKELQTDLDLNHYDYGARFYDPVISRFTTLDPKAEIYDHWAPYLYGANNPIRYEDTNGEGPGDKVLGFAAALIDNATGGLTNVRSLAANYVGADGAVDFNMGQDFGDVASIVVGVSLIEGGTGAGAAGVVAAPATGGSSLVATAVGAAAVAEGAVLVGTGAGNFTSQKGRLNAKKVTPEKQQNLDKAAKKGIPKSQLGPSGKPKIHNPSKSNLKSAKDAARHNSKSNSKPVKHSSDKGQKTHFHSTRNGKKLTGKDNTHFENRSSKKNPKNFD